MDKLYTIKIKQQDGTYSEEIPIVGLAENIKLKEDDDNNLNLADILGDVKTTKTEEGQQIIIENSIQNQIDNLKNEKISLVNLNNYIEDELDNKAEDWLETHWDVDEIIKNSNVNTQGIYASSFTPSATEYRQYPIVKESDGKLSVNVPWTDTNDFIAKNIWGGKCETAANNNEKLIVLDSIDSFRESLEENEIKDGTTIAIYFKNGNTTNNPTLRIQGVNALNAGIPIYYYSIDNSTEQIREVTNNAPWYLFTPGLKVFTYHVLTENQYGWLLTTIDYALINYLKNHLTEDALTISDNLISEDNFNITALEPEQSELDADRQYPVIKDQNGKLSVNVPWTSSNGASAIHNIWTGVCQTAAAQQNKVVILDEGNNFNWEEGATLLVYFKNGNINNIPQLKVGNYIYNICYQGENGNIYQLNPNSQNILKSWGAGLKIFTYYIGYSVSGWLMQTSDFSSIVTLMNTKANLTSPSFTGYPTAPTQLTDDKSNKIATTAFVKNAIGAADSSQALDKAIAEVFNVNTRYLTNDYVLYNDQLYKFTENHSAGEWDRSQVKQVLITDEVNQNTSILKSYLINDQIQIQLTNQYQSRLNGIFDEVNGFTRNPNTEEYVYDYSRTLQPILKYTHNNPEQGNWLIGFKYKLTLSNEAVDISDYSVTVSATGASPKTYDGINKYQQVSLYTFANLSEVRIELQDNDSVNNSATIEIKDFYIYKLNDEIASNKYYKNYIINQQNQNYQSGTVIYNIPLLKLDTTLTQEGKIPDAKAVGDAIGNSNKYFWHNDNNESYVTGIQQEDFIADSEDCGSIIVKDGDVSIQNGNDKIANFNNNRIVLGKEDSTHIQINNAGMTFFNNVPTDCFEIGNSNSTISTTMRKVKTGSNSVQGGNFPETVTLSYLIPDEDINKLNYLDINGLVLRISLKSSGQIKTIGKSSLSLHPNQTYSSSQLFSFNSGRVRIGYTINYNTSSKIINMHAEITENNTGSNVSCEKITLSVSGYTITENTTAPAFQYGSLRNNAIISSVGAYSAGIGRNTNPSGDYAYAIGSGATASGNYSCAIGQQVVAASNNQTVLGICNANNSDNIFEIGNGNNTSSRSNALELTKTGALTVADILNTRLNLGIDCGSYPITITGGVQGVNSPGNPVINQSTNQITDIENDTVTGDPPIMFNSNFKNAPIVVCSLQSGAGPSWPTKIQVGAFVVLKDKMMLRVWNSNSASDLGNQSVTVTANWIAIGEV